MYIHFVDLVKRDVMRGINTRHRGRETDRQTDRQRQRERETETETETEIQRDRDQIKSKCLYVQAIGPLQSNANRQRERTYYTRINKQEDSVSYTDVALAECIHLVLL